MDPPFVCNNTLCGRFRIRVYRTYFCLALTSPNFTFMIFLIPCTSHPRQWSLSSPRLPALNYSCLTSNLLDLALIRKADVRIPRNALSSLPVLKKTEFGGASEYLDGLVACLDAPRLDKSCMTFFDLIVNGTPQLIRFISRTPRLKAFKVARFRFIEDYLGQVILTSGNRMLRVANLHRELDLQISSLAQVCTLSLLLLSTFGDLHVSGVQSQPPDITRNMLWLELLHPFTAVKNLYLSGEITQVTQPIVHALQELVGARTTEMLPTLENIFWQQLRHSGPVQENLGRFVATRQLVGHPVVVSLSDKYRYDLDRDEDKD